MSTKIVLVGLPGSGKSTIGKLLAKNLQCDFADLDTVITKHAKRSIADIFTTDGEAGFRAIESACLASTINLSVRLVISTGGGVVTVEKNRALLSAQKYVVYLHCPIEVLVERTRSDRAARPLLQGENLTQKMETLYARRNPWYNEVSRLTISTHELSPHHTVEAIRAWLENGPQASYSVSD